MAKKKSNNQVSKTSLFIRLIKGHRRFVLVLWIIVTLYYLLIVVINNRVALSGKALQQEQQQIDELTTQNMDLKDRIATGSSLLTIEKEATQLGFKPIASVKWITK